MDLAKPGALGSDASRQPQEVAGSGGKNAGAMDPRLQAAATVQADEALISALDESMALRILIAEVRQAVVDTLLPATATPPADAPATPATAAGSLLETFLAAVPADVGEARAWIDSVDRLEQGFATGYENAAAIVTAWRGVSAEVIASVQETQTLFAAALAGARDPSDAVRAYWPALAPRLALFRRRRRDLRRRLEDPDHGTPQAALPSDEPLAGR
jgi:hypothetical protein